jgi:hypothetical protein
VVDIKKREKISWLSMPSNDWEGIAFNSSNNSIYIRDPKTNCIFKYDQFAKKELGVIPFGDKLDTDILENNSKPNLLGRLRQWLIDFSISGSPTEREAITVNPSTNKVYC